MGFIESLSCAALILLLPVPGFTAPAGGVRGLIRDPSGAPVPGAKLTLVNATTRVQRTATSGANGAFEVLDLEPAPCALSAEAVGFKRATGPCVCVEVNPDTL